MLWQDMPVKHRLYLINLQVMGETMANELLFIVAIAPVFLGRRSLPQAFVHDKLTEMTQVAQVFDDLKGISQSHDVLN